MITPILSTKLYIPTPRPNLVSRLRLIEALKQGQQGKMTLLSAPAGFGKTTLLAEYIGQHDRPTSWVSLDDGDNDTIQFILYLLAAFQRIETNLGQGIQTTLQSGQAPQPEILLTSLINEITQIPHPFVIVLDDYHVITEPEIQQILMFLLEHQPPQMHLIISSRADPPWPLSRLRVGGEICEIRSQEMRFTREEAATFLNDIMGLALSVENIAALERRTEGWIAGLQMAALSMREHPDKDGFIRAFTGSHRFVMDYLMEEVLGQLPNETQDFLLQTSILERFSSALCEAVIRKQTSQLILSDLEQRNLFLIPLDDQRNWYRYHHLFASLLRNRLTREQPELAEQLHLRASHWFAEQGLFAEAVRHALAAGNFEVAAEIVERNVIAFKDYGELPSVVKWLQAFPDEVLFAHPWLCIAKAWTSAYVGQPDITNFLLEKTEQTLADSLDTHIRGHIAAIRCYLTLFEGDLPLCIQYGYQALEFIPETDPSTRISAATTLASALRLNGDLEIAHQVLSDAIALSKKTDNRQTTVRLLCAASAMHTIRGKLHEAIDTLHEAIEVGIRIGRDGQTKSMPVTGHAHLRLALILKDMNRLDEALEHANTGIELSKQWGQANALWEGYRVMAEIRITRGEMEGYQHAMRQAEKVAQQIAGKLATNITGAVQAQFWLREGNIEGVLRWVTENDLKIDSPVPLSDIDRYGVFTNLLIAQGKYQQAHTLLSQLLATAEKVGATAFVLSIKVRLAIVYQGLRQEVQALEMLAQALELGVASGDLRVFIDLGEPMRELLLKALSQGIQVDFVRELLTALEAEPDSPIVKKTERHPELLDDLSDRELQVLRLLMTDLSAPEIAVELIVSVSTVRSHIKNIYSKLGVHSRHEAVTRAQELGIL